MSSNSAVKMAADQSVQECPSCGHQIPKADIESPWCDSCEWNLDPIIDSSKELTIYQKIYRQIGKSTGKALFQDVMKLQPSHPRWNASKVAAFLMAGFVHLVTFSMLWLAAWIYLNMAFYVSLFLVPLALGIFWVLLPKPRSLRKLKLVKREAAPNLYRIIDDVSAILGTETVYAITVNEDFNAFYTEFSFGPWKKKVINFGLPLLDNLSDEAIVAIISHEVSHGANGDVARGVFIGSALETLGNWYLLISPSSFEEGSHKLPLLVMIGNIAGATIGIIPWTAYYVLAHLLLRQSQEAEYLADRLAAKSCGSRHLMAVLQRFLTATSYEMAISRATLSNGKIDIFAEIRTQLAKPKSSRHLDRLRRLEEKNGLSLDATHPPTSYRIEFLEAATDQAPHVKITDDQSKALRLELEHFKTEIGAKLMDNYRASIS